MARSTKALVEPSILKWARSTAGFSIEEAATSLQTKPEKLQAWEEGEECPSMAQLRKMATAYKRMLSDFYLPAAPKEDALPHDFRRLPGEVAFHYSRALRYQLRLARQRHELALDLAAELEMDVPPIKERLQLGADTEETGAELRRLLGVTLDTQRTWRDPRTSYNAWRAAIERVGILVFQAAGIPTKEMLGFTLGDRPLPVIGVNRKLQPNGRTFTLLHETVHVFLGRSSICDIEEGVLRPPEEQRTEVFCNAVAAAALVPFDVLLAEPLVRTHPARPRDWSGADPDAEFKRNMPQEVVSDLGKPFTRLVVSRWTCRPSGYPKGHAWPCRSLAKRARPSASGAKSPRHSRQTPVLAC